MRAKNYLRPTCDEWRQQSVKNGWVKGEGKMSLEKLSYQPDTFAANSLPVMSWTNQTRCRTMATVSFFRHIVLA